MSVPIWQEGDRVRSKPVPALRGVVIHATQRGRTERDRKLAQWHSYIRVRWDDDALAVASKGRSLPYSQEGRVPPDQLIPEIVEVEND